MLLQEYTVQAKRQGEQYRKQEARHNTLRTAHARAEQLEREHEALQHQCEQLRRDLDQHRDDEAQFKVLGTALKERTEILANAETAVCPICEQLLRPEHRTQLLQRNQERLETLRADYRRTQERIWRRRPESTDPAGRDATFGARAA